MINLLPPQNKQILKRTTQLRWGVVILISLGVLGIILGILLIPSYLIVSARLGVAKNQASLVNKSEGFVIDQTMKIVVDDLSKKTVVFPETLSATTTISQTFFTSIAETIPSGVYITNMNLVKKTPDDIKVQITGKSISRNALYAFSQKLEASSHFDTVVIPVSSFVKGKNTEFFITTNFTK